MWWIVFCVVLVVLLRVYYQNVYNYWKARGIPTPDYKYFFGNFGSALILKRSTGEIITDIYKQFDGLNYVGYYEFVHPALIIRSPDLVKDIMTKNFASFHDNNLEVDEKVDMILGKNPFTLKGEKWKTSRAQMTPCFSTSKLKAVMPLLKDNARKMVEYLNAEPSAMNGEGMEAKELSSKYTAENIASCAFGLEGRSFLDPQAEFRQQGVKLMTPTFWNGFIFMVIRMFPLFTNVFKIKFITDDITNFFRQLVKQTLEYRSANGVRRNDFLDFMRDLKEKINDDKEFGYDDITAHAGSFFLDGYETSAGVISYVLYELAANPDVQRKLREEINETLCKNNGEFTYEALTEIEYLDWVIKEGLRKNGPVLNLSKLCTQTFELPPINEDGTGKRLTVEKGTAISIPMEGLHMNPKYFPEPERFMPERFVENGRDIIKGTYLPFGDGPRICLGQKFGLLQSKMCIATLVRNYCITVNKRTKEPLEIDSKFFLRFPVGGIWLDFQKL